MFARAPRELASWLLRQVEQKLEARNTDSASSLLYLHRARVSHIGKNPTELSYSIGDKLRVTNTRANYDPIKETWQWYAVRERPAQDGVKREGLIAAMN